MLELEGKLKIFPYVSKSKTNSSTQYLVTKNIIFKSLEIGLQAVRETLALNR